jgi:endonuclease/exonuclease/phosphatase family metal-dependent hydrolase
MTIRHDVWSLAVGVIGAAVVGCGTGTPSAPPLRVMSFNIRYGTAPDGVNSWPNRSDLVVEVIRAQAPAVLAVQEALRFQLDDLAAAFPDYREIGVGRDDGAERGEYAAILFDHRRLRATHQGTFWLSDSPDVPGSMSWGNRVTRICTWARLEDLTTGTGFYVFNAHLDHESQASRERSVELIAERLAARSRADPLVVLGDFNAGEDNPAFRYLLGESPAAEPRGAPSPRLIDTFRAVRPEATTVGTFNAFTGDSSGAKIDAILVSPDWTILDADIVRTQRDGRYPSDHFPVSATLSLGRRTPAP